jgi:hypothetical protein
MLYCSLSRASYAVPARSLSDGENGESAEQLPEAPHDPLLDLREQDFDTQLSC